MNTYIIHIKSVDCQYIDSSTANISFSLKNPIVLPIDKSFEIQLTEISIPNSIYTVNDRNHQITMIENGTSTIFNLTNGFYNIRTLATHLQSKLNEYTQVDANYSVEFDYNTYKFTITNSEPDITTVFNFYYPYELLGFNYSQTYTMTDTLTSPNVANLNTDDALYVKSNIATINSIESYTRDYSNILAKVEINQPFGSYINLSNTQQAIISNSKAISSIQLTITDEFDDIINLNGMNWSCSIKISIIDRNDINFAYEENFAKSSYK